MAVKTRERNSSIELLKILAIMLIVISHSVPYGNFNNYDGYIDLNNVSNNINILVLAIFRNLGNIGNCIFIICSSYFLLNSKSVNKKKILKLIVDSFIISVTIFLLVQIFGTYNISLEETIKSFFPTTFNVNWFLTCYILFYMIHPFLNNIIEKLDKRKLLMVNIVLILLFSILNIIKSDLFYYNSLIGFIVIYFIMAYIKKYMNNFSANKKINIACSCLFLGGVILSIIIINFLGLRINILSNKLLIMNSFVNPLIMFGSFTLFNIFRQKETNNKAINYLSGLSLLIYLVHGNQFIAGYLKGSYFNTLYYKYGYDNIILYVIVLFMIYFIGSIVISIVYKCSIQVNIEKFVDRLYLNIKKLYSKLERALIILN